MKESRRRRSHYSLYFNKNSIFDRKRAREGKKDKRRITYITYIATLRKELDVMTKPITHGMTKAVCVIALRDAAMLTGKPVEKNTNVARRPALEPTCF